MAAKKPAPNTDQVFDAEVFRPPTDEELQIARDNRSFLAMTHIPEGVKPKAESEQSDLNDPQIAYPITIPTACDWTLHYYPVKQDKPARLIVSMGEELFGRTGHEDKDQVAVRQTAQQQTVQTAMEVVDFGLLQGWQGFRIDEGTELMKWAAWAYLDSMGKAGDSGYKPTKHDILRAKNCEGIFNKSQQAFAQSSQATPMGSVTTDSGDDGTSGSNQTES
mgnify:CR=1 FL=1